MSEQEIDLTITLSEESQFIGFADSAVGGPIDNVRIHVGIGEGGFSLKGPTAVLEEFARFILSACEPIE